jgi:hypothetical protein
MSQKNSKTVNREPYGKDSHPESNGHNWVQCVDEKWERHLDWIRKMRTFGECVDSEMPLLNVAFSMEI